MSTKLILALAILLFIYGVFCLFIGQYGWALFHILINAYTIIYCIKILKND